MAECIIHIGMHKTGTTSIQNSFHKQSNAKFLYANLGGVANHSLALYSIFAKHPEQHYLHKINNRNLDSVLAYKSAMRKDLDRSIAATNDRNLILSGEDLIILSPPELARLRHYLARKFDTITVVSYIRPPIAYMTSAFQQRVKGGGVTVSIDLDKQYPNYRAKFTKFDAIFGRENVHLWRFESRGFPDGCVVKDFSARLGIDLPKKRIIRVNESFSRQVVTLLFTYRNFGQKYGSNLMNGTESTKLAALLAQIGNDKFRFSPDRMRPILEKNRADIEWMEARLGQSLQEGQEESQLGGVRGESDLLIPDRETVRNLIALLGDAAPKGIHGDTPEEVAQLVHAARENSAILSNKPSPAKPVPKSSTNTIFRTILNWWQVGQ